MDDGWPACLESYFFFAAQAVPAQLTISCGFWSAVWWTRRHQYQHGLFFIIRANIMGKFIRLLTAIGWGLLCILSPGLPADWKETDD
jgi:hypothetical protein